jgi:hypothetical protein
MTERAAEVPQQPTPPEILRRPHTYGVVIPYSSNLQEHGDTSKERLSFYSAFALNAAIEMYEDRRFAKFVLLSDATFGEEKKSTGLLMKEALLRPSPTPTLTRRPIRETDIVLLDALHLNNTPAQIKALAEYQQQNGLQSELFLLIDWGFHDERIRSYMQEFGLNADTITVEEAHRYHNPSFQLEELQRILPEEFEEREKKLRLLARYDKRGFTSRLLKMMSGPVVTDIKKVSGSDRLGFDNTSGKEKLRQLEENPQS